MIFIFLFLLSACGKTPEPELTATPEPSATPILATPTPSPEEMLAEAWQAFEDNDLDTSREIAEAANDQAKSNGEESGEALTLLGLIEIENGKSGTALIHLEKAQEMGYESEELFSAIDSIFSRRVNERVAELYNTFDPDSIQADVHHAQEYLEKLVALDPNKPETVELTQFLLRAPFDPEDHTEADFPVDEIKNLLDIFEDDRDFNPTNTYFEELHDRYPENPIALFVYGVQQLWTDEYDEAIELLSKSVAIEPNYDNSWYYLGITYEWIGLPVHARDAYINCLILNPDNENAYESLAELNNWRGGWEDRSFETVGFTMQHFFNETFTPVGRATSKSGIMESENFLIFVNITWNPDGGDQSQENLQQQIVNAMDVELPGFKSTFKNFDYGSVPFIYRDYSYRLLGSSVYADATIAGAFCGDTVYVFDFRFLEDGKEFEEMHYLMPLYLETFSCEE